MTQEWQPIETAPKDGTRVILHVSPYGAMTGHFEMFGPIRKWNMHSCLNQSAQPTHWMPLPAPPRATGEAKP